MQAPQSGDLEQEKHLPNDSCRVLHGRSAELWSRPVVENNYLRGFVLNSRHPGPWREKWGWERRPLRHFGRITGIREIRGWIPRGHFLCAGIIKWTHLLGIGRPIFDKSEKIALGTPRHPQGIPRGPKMPSNATWFRQHVPKCRQMRHGFDNKFQNAVKCDMVSTTF